MDKAGQEKAIGAYVKFLEAKSVERSKVELRTRFVKKFVVLLDGAFNRKGYGIALQSILKIEEQIEHQDQMNFAREFYPFWVGDVKSIARNSDSYGLNLTSTQFKSLPASLEWSAIDDLSAMPLDQIETSLLEKYTISLEERTEMKSAIQAKTKLATVMLLRLRDMPMKNNMAYRVAVDMTLPLFELEDLKQLFLVTIREFFYIWIEAVDPAYLDNV